MHNNYQTILGISLGTRTIGYVILQNEKLYDWGVKSFRKRWSFAKMNQITNVIHRIIQEYDVQQISIKVPKRYESYTSIRDLHLSLCLLFFNLSIPVYTSSLNNLRLWYSIESKHPKSAITNYVESHYPVLMKRRNLSYSGQKYYLKLYEALAAAEMSLFLK